MYIYVSIYIQVRFASFETGSLSQVRSPRDDLLDVKRSEVVVGFRT